MNILATAYQPPAEPLGSLTLSALVAMLPLLTMFLTLGLLRWKAHWAGIASLTVAVVVAVAVFKMPVAYAALSASQGAAFGIFPITYIVLSAVWLYELTVVSGRFEDLRSTFQLISDDPRVLAVLIAYCFGGLMEALAGFGAPVAITGVMLMTIGYKPMRAACTVLLANTAPVAFGAIAIPIITAGRLTGIDYHAIGATVSTQTGLLAWFIPIVLLFVADGKRGVKEVWPAALVIGIAFAAGNIISAHWISVELTDIISSLSGLTAGVLFLKVWKPKGTAEAKARLQEEAHLAPRDGGAVTEQKNVVVENKSAELTPGRIGMALLPYILVVVVFSLAKLVPPITRAIDGTNIKFGWPGLDGNILGANGEPSGSTIYNFQWLSSPGTLLIIAGIICAIAFKMKPDVVIKTFIDTVVKLRWTFLTIASVLALAFVMNMSGQTVTLGTWIAGTGAAFAFFSPILGWIGTAVTGSDTSANALFATLQQTAAAEAGIRETLLVSANTAGGVIGKMISPQNLAIAATAVGLVGRESDIFRRVIGWSVGLLVLLCILIGLQSTPVLSWMLPAVSELAP
ncbi:MAG: L-lactate permease [Flaviflexus sp.]|nr:L-lactate permease [Flaviflexus sp.]